MTCFQLLEFSIFYFSEKLLYSYNEYIFHDSGISLHDKTSITFYVNAKNDANIALSENNIDGSQAHEDLNVYEIVIGGWLNKASSVCEEKRGPEKCKASTPEILTPGVAQPFWISWDNGNIRFGREHQVGYDVICEWHDPTPRTINYLSITTRLGSDGKWIFHNKGETFFLFINLLF